MFKLLICFGSITFSQFSMLFDGNILRYEKLLSFMSHFVEYEQTKEKTKRPGMEFQILFFVHGFQQLGDGGDMSPIFESGWDIPHFCQKPDETIATC